MSIILYVISASTVIVQSMHECQKPHTQRHLNNVCVWTDPWDVFRWRWVTERLSTQGNCLCYVI